MIQQVVLAASVDETRPVLMGVLTTIDQNTITMAAADGFRLSVRKAQLSSAAQQPLTAIIPARALSELARVATDEDEMISMMLPKNGKQVIFRVKYVELVSKLIDGTFPDYQQIIPSAYKSRVLISTQALLKACKQAEIFAREGTNKVQLNIKLEPGLVEVFAQSEETGSNETVVEATIEGVGLLIAFNVKYLREVLEVVKAPNVALETSAPNAAAVIRPVGEDNFLHVIMPLTSA